MLNARTPVIIPSEIQSREFDAKLLLACILAERGFPCVVGSRNEIHMAITRLPRSIYVGKDVSGVRVAMVINNPSAYWREGEAGMTNAAKELGVKADFQGPPGGDLTAQLSLLDTLRSQKVGIGDR